MKEEIKNKYFNDVKYNIKCLNCSVTNDTGEIYEGFEWLRK